MHAFPLTGYEDNLLGVLLIASSRRDLVELEAFLWRLSIVVAAGGILLGIALSWWATARITRPVQRLAESAGKVAEGKLGHYGRGDYRRRDRATGSRLQSHDARTRLTSAIAWSRPNASRPGESWPEGWRARAEKPALSAADHRREHADGAREPSSQQFDEVFREGTATLLAELGNLKQIISRFSDFAKMPAPEMQTVNMNELVNQTMKLLAGQLAQARVIARIELDSNLAHHSGRRGTN